MKILAAIEADGSMEKLDMTLRWASRSGYVVKVFINDNRITEDATRRELSAAYANALADANYHWYLALDPEADLVVGDPMEYARDNGFDLLLRIPEGLELWRRRRHFDGQVFFLCDSAGRARLEFSKKPGMRVKHWRNGAMMERVRKP